MNLYRGSRIKTENVQAQEVLPFDLPKIHMDRPTKVIWASPHKESAWIFGIFWQRMSVKINTTFNDFGEVVHRIQVARKLTPKELEEIVYLYTLDGSTFSCVSENDQEYFSFENELPATRESRKIHDILTELVRSKKVEVTVNPALAKEPKK